MHTFFAGIVAACIVGAVNSPTLTAVSMVVTVTAGAVSIRRYEVRSNS